ncbi:hypothetical protein J2T18_004598 [Paenibacillus polymyxa]|uniref:hypothetical protein n=1 Tax=Paenibacillus polymyxa TaxID=1406 RepID=UPI00278DEA91|nr:hypothetical protein [Paenibacillus polymyxa]MDQ0050270.1 hypothetical protein [Paenibacillus polymyxa]
MEGLKQRVGCLHAHHSNIAYMDRAFASYEVELVHFVDPGLMRRISSDPHFSADDASRKVEEQLRWIAQSDIDVILITCTNYTVLAEKTQLTMSTPIIALDEPFFHEICDDLLPRTLVFTNPATVEGTMKRLYHTATLLGKPDISSWIEVKVVEDAFELIMQGRKDEYKELLVRSLYELREADPSRGLAVAQLSMVDAALQVELETGQTIGNPLRSLSNLIEDLLG